jgi:hypothetical protein
MRYGRGFLHIGNQDRPVVPRGRATDARTRLDADAGGASLERAEHERIVTQKVKSGPVKARKRMVDRRRRVGGGCCRVGLAGQQCIEFLRQIAVKRGLSFSARELGPRRRSRRVMHGEP